MTTATSRTIAYSIIVLLAVIFVGILVSLQIRGGAARVRLPSHAPPAVEGLRPEEAASAFDTAALKDERYLAIDQSLFDAGRLPVPVPGARGKPNLF